MLKLSVKAQEALQSLKDDRGQDLVEYALLAGLITVLSVASITTLGTQIAATWASIAGSL